MQKSSAAKRRRVETSEDIFVHDAFIDHILTGEMMTDPVMAEDDRTYDRNAITAWFSSRKERGLPITSPLTMEIIGEKLRPNVDMKRAIEESKEAIARKQASQMQSSSSAASAMSSVMLSIHDLGKHFECLDQCRDILQNALGGWTPPSVIMIGSENTGKSSVLERLALMSIFPRAEGLCTRLPIHARLRRTATALPPVLVVYNVVTKEEEVRRVIPFQTGHIDVRIEMDRLLKQSNGSLSGIDSTHIIILHIHSPRVPSIDLIDLPGIVACSAPGEPIDLPTATRDLVVRHIDECQGRAMYLAVTRATTSTNKDVAFGLVQEEKLEVP